MCVTIENVARGGPSARLAKKLSQVPSIGQRLKNCKKKNIIATCVLYISELICERSKSHECDVFDRVNERCAEKDDTRDVQGRGVPE